MFSKKGLIVLGILVLALGLLIACAKAEEKVEPTPTAAKTPAAAVGKPVYGGVLPTYTSADPPMFDGFETLSYLTQPVLSAIYDKLVGISSGVPRYQEYLVPELAESWEVTETTYVFHLKKGVKFSSEPPVNGREVVAEDVKWTYEQYAKSVYKKFMVEQVAQIECPDKYTVKFTMKEPFTPFEWYTASSYMVIYPREIKDTYGDMKRWEYHKGCGTGPWCLAEYVPSVRLVYNKNPNYHQKDVNGNPIPYLDSVRVPIIPDTSTRIAALRSAQIYSYGPPQEEVNSIASTNPDLCYREDLPLGLSQIWMRTDKPPFNDVKVRQAVALAIDHDGMIASLFGGKGEKFTMLPGRWRAYRLDWDKLGEGSTYMTHDVTLAKKLLAEAGYPAGFDTLLNVTTVYGETHVNTYELIHDYLNQVGIRVKINVMEYGAFLANVYSGSNYEGMGYGPHGESGDPDMYLYDMLYPGASRNQSHVDDPWLSEMVVKQRQELDPVKRVALIQEIQRYCAVQNYYVYRPAGYGYTFWQPWVHNIWNAYLGYDNGHDWMMMWVDRDNPRCAIGPGLATSRGGDLVGK